MAKRFIDTNLFDDPWFMDLSIEAKVLWIYSLTKCDHAGILDFNAKLCMFQTGIEKDMRVFMSEIGKKWTWLENGKIFIKKFIDHQYGELQENNRVHVSVINILKKEGAYKGLTSPMEGCKDIDKEQDKAKDKEKNIKEKFVLPSWIPVEDWNGFVEMRKKIKKPMTDRAKEMAVNDLIELCKGELGWLDKGLGSYTIKASKILKQSEYKNWQTLYEPKECSKDPAEEEDVVEAVNKLVEESGK